MRRLPVRLPGAGQPHAQVIVTRATVAPAPIPACTPRLLAPLGRNGSRLEATPVRSVTGCLACILAAGAGQSSSAKAQTRDARIEIRSELWGGCLEASQRVCESALFCFAALFRFGGEGETGLCCSRRSQQRLRPFLGLHLSYFGLYWLYFLQFIVGVFQGM